MDLSQTVSRVRRTFGLTLLFSAFCIWVVPVATAQATSQQDNQALTILARTIAAGGGQSLLAAVQDLTETGTATFPWADQASGNVTIKSRGLHEFRMDADLPDGKRSTVISASGGALIDVDGTMRPILRQSAAVLGNMTFPYLPLIAAIQDPSTTRILYEGLVNRNGSSVYDIRIQRVYAATADPLGTLGPREARDFYIDPNSSMVIAVSDQIYFGSQDSGVSHQIQYSGYQSQNGVLVPMTVIEAVNGTPSCTIQVSQVAFNSNLPDSDFDW